jgi:hypothetical protein
MTARKYPFYPAWNGEATSPITKKFYELSKKRWGFTNLGMYANRPMRGSKNLSVHATGFALDMGYPATRAGRAAAKECWDWLVANSEALLLCELHDYNYIDPKQDPADKTHWGRGYRCSRGPGKKGIKLFTSKDNAGTPGGCWLHVEISNTWATPADFEAAWRLIPKPEKALPVTV